MVGGLEFGQVFVEAIEAIFPVAAIMLEPIGCLAHGLCVKAAGAPLGIAAAGDEAAALEDLEVLGDGGEADFEGACDL